MSEYDDLLSHLTPANALHALQSPPNDLLQSCLQTASFTEKQYVYQAALAARKIYDWIEEVHQWPWPSNRSSSAGFERPDAEYLAWVKHTATEQPVLDDTAHNPSSLHHIFLQYEPRGSTIAQELENGLMLEEIKDHVLHKHIAPLTQAQIQEQQEEAAQRLRDRRPPSRNSLTFSSLADPASASSVSRLAQNDPTVAPNRSVPRPNHIIPAQGSSKALSLSRRRSTRRDAASTSSLFASAANYRPMADISAVLAAIVVQILPLLTRLRRHLQTWSARFEVLHTACSFVASISDAERSLETSWQIVQDLFRPKTLPSPPYEASHLLSASHTAGSLPLSSLSCTVPSSSSCTISSFPTSSSPTIPPNHDPNNNNTVGPTPQLSTRGKRTEFDRLKRNLEHQVATSGRLLDTMLDCLEGYDDTLPPPWLDRMEAVEQSYTNWMVFSERKLRESAWSSTSSTPSATPKLLQDPSPAASLRTPSPVPSVMRHFPSESSDHLHIHSLPLPSSPSPISITTSSDKPSPPCTQTRMTTTRNDSPPLSSPTGLAILGPDGQALLSTTVSTEEEEHEKDDDQGKEEQGKEERGKEEQGKEEQVKEKQITENSPKHDTSAIPLISTPSDAPESIMLLPSRHHHQPQSRTSSTEYSDCPSILSPVDDDDDDDEEDYSDVDIPSPVCSESTAKDFDETPLAEEPIAQKTLAKSSSKPNLSATIATPRTRVRRASQLAPTVPTPPTLTPKARFDPDDRLQQQISHILGHIPADIRLEAKSPYHSFAPPAPPSFHESPFPPRPSTTSSTIPPLSSTVHRPLKKRSLHQLHVPRHRTSSSSLRETSGIRDTPPPRTSRARTPSFTLAPAASPSPTPPAWASPALAAKSPTPSHASSFSSSPHPRSSSRNRGQQQDIKVYHLSRSTGEAPVKLFIRMVGESGERVMVRVGGGWADLEEYLRDYATHHRRRSLASSASCDSLSAANASTSLTAQTAGSGHTGPQNTGQGVSANPGFDHRPTSAREVNQGVAHPTLPTSSPVASRPGSAAAQSHNSLPHTSLSLSPLRVRKVRRGSTATLSPSPSPTTPIFSSPPAAATDAVFSSSISIIPSPRSKAKSLRGRDRTLDGLADLDMPTLARENIREDEQEEGPDRDPSLSVAVAGSPKTLLGLAGPHSRPVALSKERRAWVQDMKARVRIASGELRAAMSPKSPKAKGKASLPPSPSSPSPSPSPSTTVRPDSADQTTFPQAPSRPQSRPESRPQSNENERDSPFGAEGSQEAKDLKNTSLLGPPAALLAPSNQFGTLGTVGGTRRVFRKR